MWEYSILDEVTIDGDSKFVIIHADSIGSVRCYLRVECDGPLKQDLVGKGDNVIHRIENNIAFMMFGELNWDAENPLFEWPRVPDKMEAIQKAIAIWNDDFESVDYPKDKDGKSNPWLKEEQDKIWTEGLGARMNSVEWIIEGELTKPIYEAEKVTQVLSKAGKDDWELVGNIPSGDKRMLRRKR